MISGNQDNRRQESRRSGQQGNRRVKERYSIPPEADKARCSYFGKVVPKDFVRAY